VNCDRAVGDADSGDNPYVVAGLEPRTKRDVAAVRKDFQMSLPGDDPAQRVAA
jgi:hypothetical protein